MAPIMTGKVPQKKEEDLAELQIGLPRVPTPKISRPKDSEVVADEMYKNNIGPRYKLRRFYLPAEVATHNSQNDCWVTLFNKVYDLTKLIAENAENPLCDPIVLAGGTDITHWFDPATKDPKTYVNPATNQKEFLCPMGRYLHVPTSGCDLSSKDTAIVKYTIPWWRDDEQYSIGHLTELVRKIVIVNTLTKDEQLLDCAHEENMNEILDRFLPFNAHAASYTWKRLGKVLDMNATLAQNGIADETEECLQLGIDPEEYIPAVHIYFNDDLTIA